MGQDSDRAKSLEARFDEHLVKPIDPETLLQCISHGAPGNAARREPPGSIVAKIER